MYKIVETLDLLSSLSRAGHSASLRKDRDRSTGCLFMFFLWMIVYEAYKKCLHLLLRRMRYPLIPRRKLIDALWCTGFTFVSSVYLIIIVPETQNGINAAEKAKYIELGIILHKSFYLHRAVVEILRGDRSRAATTVVFVILIHILSQLKWFDILMNVLFFKSSLMLILSFCKILSVIKAKERTIKILLGIYLLDLIYVHLLVVPNLMVSSRKDFKEDISTLVPMWVWLFFEFADEIRNMGLGYVNDDKWIEAYLFAPPSLESIHLSIICKKLRQTSFDKGPGNVKTQTKVWQTLSCAILMKKKVKRFRALKKNLATEDNQP